MNSYLKSIQKFTSVLEIFDINYFFHLRINKQNQFFILSNNKEISSYLEKCENHIGVFLTEIAETSISGKISITFWDQFTEDYFLVKMYQLGICSGISLGVPFDDYIDIYSFASSLTSKKLNNFYLNHLRFLKRFIVYFRINAKKEIQRANKNLFSLHTNIKLYSRSKEDKKVAILHAMSQQALLKEALIKRIYLPKSPLTKKEIICLVMLLAHKSVRSISLELHMSQRSIESCIETIKSKTGFNTKAELLNAFYEKKSFYRVFIMTEVIDVSNIQKVLANFAKIREWGKFHSPKNLSMAIAGEAGELLEIFQWFTERESINIKNDLVIKEKVSQELADIILYTILIADKLNINLNDAIHNKILDNNIKYPVNKVKGSAKKYTEY